MCLQILVPHWGFGEGTSAFLLRYERGIRPCLRGFPESCAARRPRSPHATFGWRPLPLPRQSPVHRADDESILTCLSLRELPVLTHYAVLMPHGDAFPGALTAGDLRDLAGSLAPRPLRWEVNVDHKNQIVPVCARCMLPPSRAMARRRRRSTLRQSVHVPQRG